MSDAPRAIVLRRGEGEVTEARGSRMTFKAVAADTGGRFSLMERDLPPGGRMPPPHVHRVSDEAFLVLHGEVEFALEGQAVRGEAGTFVLVPHGVPHTFGNTSDAPAQVLVLHVPAMDGYFRELRALWSGDLAPTRQEEIALMRRHETESA